MNIYELSSLLHAKGTDAARINFLSSKEGQKILSQVFLGEIPTKTQLRAAFRKNGHTYFPSKGVLSHIAELLKTSQTA